MNARLSLDFHFAAALRLPNDDGPGKRMHGHNYRLQVTVDGEPDPYEAHRRIFDASVALIDHRTLNDFVANPTTANVARWFWEKVASVEKVVEVKLWQTPEICVTITGP